MPYIKSNNYLFPWTLIMTYLRKWGWKKMWWETVPSELQRLFNIKL